jgi:hypothetical protein
MVHRAGWKAWRGWALSAVGLLLLVLVIRSVGAQSLVALLQRARLAFAVALALEGVRIALEGLGSASLFGASRGGARFALKVIVVELRTYAVCQLAPMGRTAAEALKIPLLKRHAGVRDRIAVAVRSQALSLAALAVLSVPCAIAIDVAPLRWAVALHAAVVTVGALLLMGMRAEERMTALAARRWPRLFDDAPRSVTRRGLSSAGALFLGAKVVTLAQIGVLGAAVTGAFGLGTALSVTGIHFTGAGAGDFLPGHLGSSEAALALSSARLGVDAHALLAVALLLRAVQVLWALASVLFDLVLLREVGSRSASRCNRYKSARAKRSAVLSTERSEVATAAA